MAHNIIEYDCICTSCEGTGLYKGFGERDGFAVVCYRCKGTGKRHEKIEYDDPLKKRKTRTDIIRVLQANPGIGVGISKERGLTLESFGGMPYIDWQKGLSFPLKSEMRNYTCPAWWYQSADYDKKPDWDECMLGGMFSHCDHFGNKHLCWAKFDNYEQVKADKK